MSDQHDWAGRFVWYDLMCTDVDAAKAFYGEVLGWQFQPMPMGGVTYHVIKSDDRMQGGIMPLDPGFPLPSHWMSYLSVSDVDAACEQVSALGGEVCHAAFDLPNVGRTAIVADPNGAPFHLFRSDTPGGSHYEGMPQPGWFCWTQLLTGDVEKASAFYTALLPWETHGGPDAASGQVTFQRPGDPFPLASMMPRPAEAKAERDHWLPYVTVVDCAETTRRAEEQSAKILVRNMDIGDMATMSVLTDPTGAQVALWQMRAMMG